MVFLDVSAAECVRRSTGRKIDPTTSTIYHEDSPAPESDAKLLERLQDYTDESGDAKRLRHNHTNYDRTMAALLKWCY